MSDVQTEPREPEERSSLQRLASLLARWRALVEESEMEMMRRDVSSLEEIDIVAYQRGVNELADAIDREILRAGVQPSTEHSNG